jgi:signal peptidase II
LKRSTFFDILCSTEMKKITFVFIILLLLDQVTKLIARFFFYEPAEELPFVGLETTHNTGIAFSIPVHPLIITILTIGVLIYLAWNLAKKELFSWETVAFTFIFTGAVGNFLDRIFLGSVTDFIRLWELPIFNFADIFIFFGVMLYLWYTLKNAKEEVG